MEAGFVAILVHTVVRGNNSVIAWLNRIPYLILDCLLAVSTLPATSNYAMHDAVGPNMMALYPPVTAPGLR